MRKVELAMRSERSFSHAKSAKVCLLSCSDRQDAKDAKERNCTTIEKIWQFLAILALPARVCSQADLERAMTSGREIRTRNAECGTRNGETVSRQERKGDQGMEYGCHLAG